MFIHLSDKYTNPYCTLMKGREVNKFLPHDSKQEHNHALCLSQWGVLPKVLLQLSNFWEEEQAFKHSPRKRILKGGARFSQRKGLFSFKVGMWRIFLDKNLQNSSSFKYHIIKERKLTPQSSFWWAIENGYQEWCFHSTDTISPAFENGFQLKDFSIVCPPLN